MVEVSPAQVWSLRKGNFSTSYKAVILKVDANHNGGIIHVAVLDGADEILVQHMPFTRSAFVKSVDTIVGTVAGLPDFSEGYQYWRSEFDRGNAGVYDIEIAEALAL